ncbi:MAG: peptidoglycan-binding protein [Acidimicrobiia bacterium]
MRRVPARWRAVVAASVLVIAAADAVRVVPRAAAQSRNGVSAFGEATFHGSMGGEPLAQPVVGMAASPSGEGYWLVASDGGIFTFGDAAFHGSMGGRALEQPVVNMAADPEDGGYWLVDRAGQVFPFGVPDLGSATEDGSGGGAATVDIAALSTGDGYWLAHGGSMVVEAEDTGPGVRSVQSRLWDLGYWTGPIDGVFGTLTEQAVYAFQKVQGLPVTGRVGFETALALEGASRPTPRSRTGDLVEIDKDRQVLFVVRDGQVLWTFNTSTGTEEPYTYEGQRHLADTPPGRWDVYRRADGVEVSHLGRLYRPIYFHRDGIAVHGYSFVPPYPASHGCVRVTNAAIDLIWDEDLMPLGSTVWVYGTTPDV